MFVARAVGLVLSWQVVETAPALTVLDIFKLFVDFLLGVAGSLDDLPEIYELFQRDLAVVVDVDGVEEFAGGDFAESALPVVESLGLVNCVAAVNVKDAKHLVDVLQSLWRKILSLNKSKEEGVSKQSRRKGNTSWECAAPAAYPFLLPILSCLVLF